MLISANMAKTQHQITLSNNTFIKVTHETQFTKLEPKVSNNQEKPKLHPYQVLLPLIVVTMTSLCSEKMCKPNDYYQKNGLKLVNFLMRKSE